MKNKKGQAFLIIILVVSIIMIGFIISVLMKPLKVVYDATYNDTSVQEDDYQTFFIRAQTIWIWLPFLIGIGLIIWFWTKSHERGGYG